jgi:hypothetical protein
MTLEELVAWLDGLGALDAADEDPGAAADAAHPEPP